MIKTDIIPTWPRGQLPGGSESVLAAVVGFLIGVLLGKFGIG